MSITHCENLHTYADTQILVSVGYDAVPTVKNTPCRNLFVCFEILPTTVSFKQARIGAGSRYSSLYALDIGIFHNLGQRSRHRQERRGEGVNIHSIPNNQMLNCRICQNRTLKTTEERT